MVVLAFNSANGSYICAEENALLYFWLYQSMFGSVVQGAWPIKFKFWTFIHRLFILKCPKMPKCVYDSAMLVCYLMKIRLLLQPESKDSDWVRIMSNDGFSFMVKRKVANTSGTLKSMLDTESE